MDREMEPMTDGRKPPQLRHTPVPTDGLLELAKSMARVEIGVESIKSDLLPPVAKAAGEARDTALKLEGWTKDITRRVKVLETTPPTPHPCLNEDRLDGHDGQLVDQGKSITGLEREQAGLSRWRTYLTAIVVPVLLFAGGAAGKAVYDSATTRAMATQNGEDNDDQDGHIEALEAARTRDLERVIGEVQGLPAKVQQAEARAEAEELSVEEAKARMTDRQRRRMDALLREAGVEADGP